MTDLKSIPSHSPKLVSRKTGNEYVLVPVTNNIADMNCVYTLNDTGAFIWEQIDGKRSVEEIIQAVTKEYEIDYETTLQDVFSFIESMGEYIIMT